MKYKILLIFALAIAVCMAGCQSGGSYCSQQSYPFIPYTVLYPDNVTITGGTGADGVAAYPSRGFPCYCIAVLFGSSFGYTLSADPSSVNLNAPPTTFTITGQGISGQYGMPKVEYFDGNGYPISSVTATSVGADGTWLQASSPDLSSVYSGTYQIRVTNMRSDGYYLDLVGSATVEAWGRDAPPDGGGDGGGQCCGRGCYCY